LAAVSVALGAFGVACKGAEDETALNDEGTPPVDRFARCERTEDYGPGAPGGVYACRASSPSPEWHEGDATPPGDYVCSCSGAREVSVLGASGCEAAMAEACQIDLDGPLPCSVQDGNLTGDPYVCWPSQTSPGMWRCQCQADAETIDVSVASCELAALEACVPLACFAASGTCELKSGEAGYDCACATGDGAQWSGVPSDWRRPTFGANGSEDGPGLGFLVGANACEDAISLTCTPSCQNDNGACRMRPDGFSCTCVGNDEAAINLLDSNTNCPAAIERACGAG
jgi:hypothetical protein